VRYIQHRPGKDGEKIIRTLFNREGEMERSDAYRMIDEARKTDIIFRFVISPDPNSEDKERDLDMRQITENTMLKLEEIVGKTVHWIGAIHADHTDKRHVHAFAVVPGRLYTAHLNLITHSATKACLEQRQELDLVRNKKERERELREEAEWGRGL
jgi:hypothetical protein